MQLAISKWEQFSPRLDKISWALWAILLITIPVTSSPLIALFIPETSVSPLSGIPLVLLLLVWVIPYLVRGGKLPKITLPLFVFVAIALVATLRAPFLEIYPVKGITLSSRSIRALITLVFGVGFYFVASTLPLSKSKLRASLRWLYLGAVLMFLWSTVQILRLPFSFNPQPIELARIHKYISVTDLFRDRISGMAYEPSWLADQLTILYLPILLASVVAGYSAFRRIWKRLTVEHILLVWGSVVLFFTYSRIGLVAFVATIGVLTIGVAWRFIEGRIQTKHSHSRWSKGQIRFSYWLLVFILFLAAVFVLMLLTVSSYERFYDLITIDLREILESERLPPIYNLVNQLKYAERVMYWVSAFLVFSQFPLLGVGLGNVGFFFQETIPAFGYYLPEILLVLGPHRASIANAKSLWLRLLAETGLLGFLVFVVWLIILGLGAKRLLRAESRVLRVLAIAGGLTLVAEILEGFSLDTFALPQLWIVLGLLTAGLTIQSRENNGESG
jgi:hypothetical protein